MPGCCRSCLDWRRNSASSTAETPPVCSSLHHDRPQQSVTGRSLSSSAQTPWTGPHSCCVRALVAAPATQTNVYIHFTDTGWCGYDTRCCCSVHSKADVGQTNLPQTHTRLTAHFPGLPKLANTREVKPIWILLEQETVSGSGISWAICKSAPDK